MLLLLPLATRIRWKALAASLSGLAVGIAPYLLWSRFTYGSFLHTLRLGWANVEGPVEPFTYFLRNAPTIFTPIALIGLLLSLIAQLASLRTPHAPEPATSSQRFVKPYLWLWLLLSLLFFSLMPHKEPRYILPLAPPVLLLASFGLALFIALPNKPLRQAAAILLAFVLFLTFLPLRERLSAPFLNSATSDEESASTFLQSTLPANTTLYMSFNYPAFAFYTNFRIHELSTAGPALYQDMDHIPPGQILIVYRQAEDPSQSDIPWAAANPKFQRLRDYPSFVIFRCLAPPPKELERP
jgi:hypothetical protein